MSTNPRSKAREGKPGQQQCGLPRAASTTWSGSLTWIHRCSWATSRWCLSVLRSPSIVAQLHGPVHALRLMTSALFSPGANQTPGKSVAEHSRREPALYTAHGLPPRPQQRLGLHAMHRCLCGDFSCILPGILSAILSNSPVLTEPICYVLQDQPQRVQGCTVDPVPLKAV